MGSAAHPARELFTRASFGSPAVPRRRGRILWVRSEQDFRAIAGADHSRTAFAKPSYIFTMWSSASTTAMKDAGWSQPDGLSRILNEGLSVHVSELMSLRRCLAALSRRELPWSPQPAHGNRILVARATSRRYSASSS